MKEKTKSPLTAKPLRNPGQSLDEEIEKIYSKDIELFEYKFPPQI